MLDGIAPLPGLPNAVVSQSQAKARLSSQSKGEIRMTADDAGATRDAEEEGRGLRERLSSQAEDAIGRLADDLLENQLINSAIQRALGARDRVAQAQESAMDALNIPSASNLDKIARRLRSISQRLEEVEDGVERLDRRLQDLSRDVTALRSEAGRGEAVPTSQPRAVVPEG